VRLRHQDHPLLKMTSPHSLAARVNESIAIYQGNNTLTQRQKRQKNEWINESTLWSDRASSTAANK